MADASNVPRYPSMPGDADEQARYAAARLRLRLLRGEWLDDLQRHMGQHFDPIREHAVGKPDLSTNLFAAVIDQLAVLYDRAPVLRHDDADAAERASEMLGAAGWWSLGSMLQRYVLGCREAFVRPTLTADNRLLLRTVTSDLVHAEASADDPDLPAAVREYRLRDLGDGQQWYVDVLDVRDPAAPVYRIERVQDGADVTEDVRGVAGWPDQFRAADGSPVMPYATYHARRTGRLWDWRTGSEAVEGTLTVAVLWSWWVHCVRDSAWSQRWTIDAAVRGARRSGSGAAEHSAIVTDPSSVMQFQSDGDRASIGQWVPAIDPLTLGTSLGEFEQRLLVHFGLSPGDVQRSEGSAQSGYAITLKRESVRQAQRRMTPEFARGDAELLRIVSCLTRGTADAIPEDGWSITYPGPPKSWDETQAELDRLAALADLGLASKVDAYMELHQGTSRDAATAELQRIESENRALGALRPMPQPGLPAR